ncbi:MAG: phenylacetate--CoA ligase [Nitrospirae bacterium GWC2_56_14]|nr:MAG: phenylacetate--CoA ligase [Nitrospirae bacterium GWC2_56_14]
MPWNAEETLSRPELTKLQSERLQRVCERVYSRVPFYQKKFDAMGVKPTDIKNVQDIVKLPFTKKADLRDNYPYGLFAEPLDEIVRIHASSGTTGKPTVVAYNRNDINLWAEVMARTFTCAGTTKKDVVQNAYGYGLFTGGLGAHYGAERVGAAVIPISGGNTQKQILLLQDFGSTVITCTPSFALYIYDVACEMKISLDTIKLRVGLFGAEPWTEEMRHEIEERLRIKAIDIYGLSEIIGPGVSSECVEAQSGLHVNEDHFYPEIINPETGEQLPYGQEGELVITSMSREAMPLIRYRTGDITSLNPEKCVCGRTLVRMRRVRGRADDMLIIRGVNVFPSQVESVLLRSEEVAPHYIIEVNRKGRMDEMNVLVEVTPKFMEKMASKVLSTDLKDFVQEEEELVHLKREIQKNVKDIIGVNTDITLRPPNTIQRSEGKAKRVIDNRPK